MDVAWTPTISRPALHRRQVRDPGAFLAPNCPAASVADGGARNTQWVLLHLAAPPAANGRPAARSILAGRSCGSLPRPCKRGNPAGTRLLAVFCGLVCSAGTGRVGVPRPSPGSHNVVPRPPPPRSQVGVRMEAPGTPPSGDDGPYVLSTDQPSIRQTTGGPGYCPRGGSHGRRGTGCGGRRTVPF